MNMKYTRGQIENTICKWSNDLLESKQASEDEVKELIGEGLFKRAKDYVKNSFKHVGQGIASGVKKVALKVHDTFAANKGVAKLMDAIEKLMKKGKKAGKIKLYVVIDDKNFPVAQFALSKSRKALAFLFDEKTKKAKTYEDLDEYLADCKVAGNDRHITSFVDALLVGKVEDEDMLAESSSTLKRLPKVLDALGWKSKDALKPENIDKIASLLGYQNKTTTAAQIAEYYKSKGEKGVDDPTMTSDDPPSSEEKDSEGKKKEDAGGEGKDIKSKDAGEGKEDEEKPGFNKGEKEQEKQSANHMLMKTYGGETVGVMNNPFKKVVTQGDFIGVFFDVSKEEAEKRKRQRASLKH